MWRTTAASRTRRAAHSGRALTGLWRKAAYVLICWGWTKDLQVAEQVGNHVAEEEHTGDGHDAFLPMGAS